MTPTEFEKQIIFIASSLLKEDMYSVAYDVALILLAVIVILKEYNRGRVEKFNKLYSVIHELFQDEIEEEIKERTKSSQWN